MKTYSQVKQKVEQDKYSSAATKLLQKRKELYDAYELLDKQRVEFQKEEKQIKQREEQIKNEDEKIQTDLVKFYRFIKNNESKKQRAIHKIQQEKLELQNKNKQLQDILKEIKN